MLLTREEHVMANSSTPFGFMPYGRLAGGSPTEELQQVPLSTGTQGVGYFTGDLVSLSSRGGTLMSASASLIGVEDGTVVPSGVFWGCEFFSAAAARPVWGRTLPEGTVVEPGAKAWIISDPNVTFRCAGTGTFAAADIGKAIRPISSQSSLGNTATGQSAQIVSTAAVTDPSSAPFLILDLLANRAVAGTPGTDAAAFNQIIVLPNAWWNKAGTVGAST